MATCSFGDNGWSAWKVSKIEGEDGVDGPGAEYVYVRTNTDVAPTVRSKNGSVAIIDTNGHTYEDDEFLPLASGGDLQQDTQCTDDPLGVDFNHQFEWEAKRVKVLPDNYSKERVWEEYTGTMSLRSN